jgi:hypothetical protein
MNRNKAHSGDYAVGDVTTAMSRDNDQGFLLDNLTEDKVLIYQTFKCISHS